MTEADLDRVVEGIRKIGKRKWEFLQD